MNKIKGWLLNAASAAAALALIVATSSVATTCYFTAYQPDVPKDLL